MMLMVISPAKSLNTAVCAEGSYTVPLMADRAAQLVARLRQLSAADLGALMGLSEPLAQLNVQRYAAWGSEVAAQYRKPAVLLFDGDVYAGLDAGTLTADHLAYAQRHLRILSGLYGLLRPLDVIEPHRLEMGTPLATDRGNTLYHFWGDSIAAALQQQMAETGAQVLLQLASQEYFRAIQPYLRDIRVLTCSFKEYRNGKLQTISFYAKKARGQMARFAIVNQLTHPEHLKAFDTDGYRWLPEASTANEWVFAR